MIHKLLGILQTIIISASTIFTGGTAPAVAQPSHPTQTPPAIINNVTQMPIGIFAVKEYGAKFRQEKNPSFDPETYKNPYITGVSLRIAWKDLEPDDGNFNWNITDEVFREAQANGKSVKLIIVPGFDTPPWALQGAQNEKFHRKYGRGAGGLEPLPLPWDETYLNRWFSFLREVSNRYGKNPVFKAIEAAGPTSVSGEMSLPNSRKDVKKWIALGYTPQRYINAWAKTFQAYSQIFPNQYFGLALYPGLPINDQGQIDRNQRAVTRQKVIDEGLKYPARFTLQTSGLNTGKKDDKGSGGYNIVLSYNGKIVTGFQMSTSATHKPAKMGDAKDPVNALKLSVDKGVKPNESGKRIKFLEIYEPDILNQQMQQVLQYGQRALTLTLRK